MHLVFVNHSRIFLTSNATIFTLGVTEDGFSGLNFFRFTYAFGKKNSAQVSDSDGRIRKELGKNCEIAQDSVSFFGKKSEKNVRERGEIV